MREERIRLEEVALSGDGIDIAGNVHFTLYANEAVCLLTRNTVICDYLTRLFDDPRTEYRGKTYCEDIRVSDISSHCAVVHRIPQLMDNMSIAENLFLAHDEFYKYGFTNRRLINQFARDVLDEAGFKHLKATTLVGDLSRVEQHYVEILKGMLSGNAVLVFEEITSAFRPYELLRLKTLLKYVIHKGISILYLTDKIDNVIDVVDRIIIVRSKHTIENYSGEDNIDFINRVFAPKPTVRGINAESESTFIIRFPDQTGLFDDGGEGNTIKVEGSEILGIYDQMWKVCPYVIGTLNGEGDRMVQLISGDGKLIKIEDQYDAIRKGIALLEEEQDNLIFGNLDLVDNITMISDVSLVGAMRTRQRKQFLTKELLERTGFSDVYQRYSGLKELTHISKDVQMVIAIARMLSASPKVFFFINPYLNFNDYSDMQFQEILSNIQKLHIPCIICSRQVEQLEKVCDRIISIN